MQNLEPRQLIEASPLFRNMQPDEAARIIARLQPVHMPAGTRILERGIWHGQLYIIASGLVSVLLQEPDDTPISAASSSPLTVAQLGAGECFGEMSLITGEPPSATIRAEQDTSLWALSQTDFLQLVGECPTLLKNINAILSQRLARANQHLLSQHSAERIWLALLNATEGNLERSLAVHIAIALARRSQKRVLLLELCGVDEAVGPHFSTFKGQVRPSLQECARDSSRLQKHRAPLITGDGKYYPAWAALGTTHLEEIDAGTMAALLDITQFYDYLLLVTTPATPASVVRAVASQDTRVIALLAPEMASISTISELLPANGNGENVALDIFVSNVPERPTIGLQDTYAARLEHDVKRLLPADAPLLEQCWQEQKTLFEVAPDAELNRAVDFVARSISRQTVGIAFGGGGARGFAHLGVLEQLLAHRVPLDYIAACSSGIIAPGMYLIGKSFAESEEIFLQIQRQIVQWRVPRTSIFSNKGLKRMLRSLCGDIRFEDLTTPFAMVAVDLSQRAGVVMDRGLLWQAGLASVALPGIFPPVLVGDHILMDAGMHDPVPIRLLRKMGADILLASELGGQEPPALESASSWLTEAEGKESLKPSPHIIDLLLRTYDLAMATIGMHSIREADVVIRPKLHRISLRQFSEGRKFVTAGKEAVEQMLPELRKKMPGIE
jgi:NTE family protein